MDNYKDKRSGGNYSRDGKRERSYGDFNGEYRKRTRQQRFGKEGDRPQYVKVDRREDGDSRERGNARRYGSDVARYGSDRPRTRYNGDRRQGGYKAEGYERGEGSANNGNYSYRCWQSPRHARIPRPYNRPDGGRHYIVYGDGRFRNALHRNRSGAHCLSRGCHHPHDGLLLHTGGGRPLYRNAAGVFSCGTHR